MGAIAGTVVFFLIWWTVLFAVLPLGITPDPEAAPAGGWRGAPTRVRVLRVVLVTTLVTVVIWFGIEWLVRSEWMSFRHGYFSMPE
jgi:predicted secreted protein